MHETQLPQKPSSRSLVVVRVFTALAVVAALAVALVFREHLQELERYGYAAVFLVGLVSNATLILPVPGLAVSSVLGSVFNPWMIGLVAGIGQALGELTGYMAGYGSQTWVDDHPRYKRLVGWMQRYGVLTIFVLALLPNPLFDVAGIVAGVLRLGVWRFLLSCAAGKVMKNVVFALVGYYGLEIFVPWASGD